MTLDHGVHVARRLLGAPVARAVDEGTRRRADALARAGHAPVLQLVRVGESPADLGYERSLRKRAKALGVEARVAALPADAGQEQLLDQVARVNADDGVDGCLLFRPLPAGVDEGVVCDALASQKDVDGVSRSALASVFTGRGEGCAPSTAEAVVRLLDFYEVPLSGVRVAVVGRSLVVGRPLAAMLTARDATVTLCHSKTADLVHVCRESDVVIAATGRPRAFGGAFFRPGQTVVDVGMDVDVDGRLCGDVDEQAASAAVDALTPVPGGVGAVTTSVTMEHVVRLAEARMARGAAEGGRGAEA